MGFLAIYISEEDLVKRKCGEIKKKILSYFHSEGFIRWCVFETERYDIILFSHVNGAGDHWPKESYVLEPDWSFSCRNEVTTGSEILDAQLVELALKTDG